MEKINIKHLRAEFGSTRFITVLTPNTFLRKIIIISTVLDLTEKDGKNLGETAIAQAHALNSLAIDFDEVEFIPLQKHKSVKEALQFHSELINKFGFSDCENFDKSEFHEPKGDE
jgi:hypothetical protein